MLKFNNYNIETLFHVGDPAFSILDSQVSAFEVPGRDGMAVRGSRFGPSSVSFALSPKAADPVDRRNAWSELGMKLDVDEPKKLYLPDTPDRYYKAMPSGPVDVERFVHADAGRLTFLLTEPAAYGETKTETVASGVTATLSIGGTYPTKPKITAQSAVRDAAAGVWGVSSGSSSMKVDTRRDEGVRVVIDCEAGTCTVGYVARMLTLDSDWFVFNPGTVWVKNDKGSGDVNVEWTERWL